MMMEHYPYPEGIQWAKQMMAWAEGGEAVSCQQFPWQDWLELSLSKRMHLFLQREWFIKQFGYVLPNAEFIQACLAHGPFLEIGAGSGFLSKLLHQRGADIIASDIGEQAYNFQLGKWFPIEHLNAKEALRVFRNRTVLLAWPCYRENWAQEILDLLNPGQKLIYIGEDENGCNATPQFFDTLETQFIKRQCLPWKSFPYIQDRATVYQKLG